MPPNVHEPPHAAGSDALTIFVPERQQQMAAARRRHTLIAAAHGLYRDAGAKRGQIECLLWAGASTADIAEATGLP